MNSLFRSLSRSVSRQSRSRARREVTPARAVAHPAARLADAVRSCVEPLEFRRLLADVALDVDPAAEPDATAPSTSISVGNVTSGGGTTHSVTVVYDDASGINAGSIDTGDITVEQNGSSLNVFNVDVSGEGTGRTAVYTFEATGGTWNSEDNGTYTVTVNAGAVQDASAEANGNAQDTATFDVNVEAPPPPPDTTAPTAAISVGNLTSGAGSHTISVTYEDDDELGLGSIGTNDIEVLGPGGQSLNVTAADEVSVGPSNRTATVLYTIDGPGGSFDSADNGTYTVSLRAGSVTDDAGNGATAVPQSFTVNIPAPPPQDNSKPTASVAPVGDVTGAGGSAMTVVVTYNDDAAIDLGTLGTSDIDVSRNGPGGDLDVSNVATDVSNGGKTVVATYTVAAPGGTFDASDNGTYSVEVKGNAVRDTAGNGSDSANTAFAINIATPPPGDTTAPTAAVSAANVGTPGGSAHAVTVTYTDNAGIDVGTINASDITVSGPGGTLTVTGVSTEVTNGGRTVVATYTVAAPGGSFDSADNGAYTVALGANAVRDASGNAAAAASGAFTVNVAAPPPPDKAGPVAAITAANVGAPGAATHTVSVVYTDDGRIRTNTVDVGDVVVSLPGGTPLSVVNVDATSSDGGRTVTAVYTLAAPGGSWDAGDNGTYTVSLPAGAVADTQGNGSATASGSFTVNASVQDNAAPTAGGLVTGNVTTEGVTTHVVTVAYADDAGLDFATIGTDDVSVIGPTGDALVVSVVDIAQGAGGTSATVTYTFAAPAGGFTSAHNGIYTVTLNADAVRDTAGKGVAALGGSFQVAVPAPTPIDPGFGNGNAVTSNFIAEAVTTNAAEKVLVAGRIGDSAVVEVRNADGTLDATFNGTGRLVSTAENAYYAVAAQGDKIVVAGTVGGDFVLVRYLADGRLDASFGTGGRVVVDFGMPNDAAYALALAPDGKLVAAGVSDGNVAFARFGADGALDPTFAQGGMQLFDMGGADIAGAVVVQPDGKVVAAGTSISAEGNRVAVVRLGVNGEADPTFSGDGLLFVSGLTARNDATLADRSVGLTLQSDGKILVGNHTGGDNFGVARIDAGGNVDSAFGNDGVAVADFGGSDDVDAIIVQPTGEILAIGTSLSGGTGSTGVAAFSASGQMIDAFGTGGKLMLDSGVVPTARELRIGDLVLRAFGTRQSNGRVVVGTTNTAPQQTSQSALRRLNVPGTRSVTAGSQLGTFGTINGKATKFVYTDADGTKMTFTLKGGTGTAFLGADGRINLVISDGGGGATVTVKGKGGDGRIALGDVTANGTIKSLAVKNGDLAGMLCATGGIGRLTLGDVTGSICSAGGMGSVTVASLNGAKVLAGTNVGADGEFGGTGASADTFNAAEIGKLKVSGQIVGSTVGAGLDPVDATYLDEDDRVVGGAASMIKSITAKGADDSSRFLAGAFGKIKLGAKVTPTVDPRFRVL